MNHSQVPIARGIEGGRGPPAASQSRGAFVGAHPASLPEEERAAVAIDAIDEAMRLPPPGATRARQALGLDEAAA